MHPSPQEQFLLDIVKMSREDLARRSNALMDDAGREIGADARSEICRKLLVIDAIAAFKFPGGLGSFARRAA